MSTRTKLRIVFIGGASMTWMPKFFNDLINCNDLRGSTIALVDIDETSLMVIAKLGRRMVREKGANLNIEIYTNRKDALKGADFVVNTFMASGHKSWEYDLSVPFKYGIQQPKGMSIGPGGFFLGLKSIPMVLEVARDIEEICPQAWLFNYTNPMSSICFALNQFNHVKTIGLCHGLSEGIELIARTLDVQEKDIEYVSAGINHLSWMLSVKVNDKDIIPDFIEALGDKEPISRKLFQIFGAFPFPGDIHVSEFFPYFIRKGVDLNKFGLKHNYIEDRIKARQKCWKKIKKIAEGEGSLDELSLSGLEKLAQIISAIINNRKEVFYLNIINEGCVSNLPDKAIVEIPAVIDSNGAYGLHIGALPPAIAEICHIHCTVQQLTVKAAVTGSRDIALQALLLDPLSYSLDIEELEKMFDEMIAIHSQWLPDSLKV